MHARENFRYFSILDGANLTNEDEVATSPRYYGYTRPSDGHIIMRRTDLGGGIFVYEFAMGKDNPESVTNYDQNWIDRATLTNYKEAGEFKKL